MRKSFLVIILWIVITGTVFGEKSRKIVLIVPDCQTTGINLSSAQACSSFARTLFIKDGRFSLVERKYLLSILAEQHLQMTGLTDSSVQKKLGKILAADKFFVVYVNRLGEISMVDAEETFLIKLELIDVETGEIEFAENRTVGGIQSIIPALESLGEKLSASIPVSARIMSVEGNTIYLDQGSSGGIYPGKTYKIKTETRQVRDKLGKVIFRKREVIGKARITSSNADTSEISIDFTEKFPLAEGAIIELTPEP